MPAADWWARRFLIRSACCRVNGLNFPLNIPASYCPEVIARCARTSLKARPSPAKRLFKCLVLLSAAFVTAAQGQAPDRTVLARSGTEAPLSVPYQKTLQLPVAGATAAYSLDSNIVDATAANGVVEIVGKGPGSTNIVIVTPAGAQTLTVTVPVPPPILPPGFEPPERQGTGESGTYEFRYHSDPNQITNSIEMKRTQGKSFTRMQVINANLFSASGSTSAIGFPFLAYQISRPDRDITFIDKNVLNSPLTLDGFLVRGFHMRQGPWEIHGGFTSIATFQGLFLL